MAPQPKDSHVAIPIYSSPMLTVAYLANQFPAAVEPYVGEEIQELRRRGVRVIAGSVRKPDDVEIPDPSARSESLCLEPVRLLNLLRALGLMARRWKTISGLVARVLLSGRESPKRRLKALLHTWLGAHYAVQLQERGVDHIHVHHGYFGSWIGMVAARMLGISFSLTLHGSDLLLHAAYLDTKLDNCRFCVTISEYNRRYISQHFPEIDSKKIILSRLGVEGVENVPSGLAKDIAGTKQPRFTLLSAGRLQAVKNHIFLVKACARLRDLGLDFDCVIAGEGPERERLEVLIREKCLQDRVTLLGHVARDRMDSLYRNADVFVLTSLSEGIPVVLMEAMASGTIVLAPAITGIPELVIHGESGFLFEPATLDDFVQNILRLQVRMQNKDISSGMNRIRQAARLRIFQDFNRKENLTRFGDMFLASIASHDWSSLHEDPLLQQI
jgi:colanic acid/amylovoran biosynthesis glycosyltransferase